MSDEPRFTRVAAAIGEASRATMLSRLLDGRHYTGRELAGHAGVSAATASGHLKLLVDERLVRVRAQGRHRYYTLADSNVAHALEALLRVADAPAPESTRWRSPAMRELRYARSCYGHLAGELGVRLCDCLRERGWVSPHPDGSNGYEITSAGLAGLRHIGLTATTDLKPGRRHALYGCVDWSERRDHFAGPLAVAMLDWFIGQHWLRRIGQSRQLELTPPGRQHLLDGLLRR